MSFRPRKLCKADGVGGVDVEIRSGGALTVWLRAGAGTALATDVSTGDEVVTMLFEGM